MGVRRYDVCKVGIRLLEEGIEALQEIVADKNSRDLLQI